MSSQPCRPVYSASQLYKLRQRKPIALKTVIDQLVSLGILRKRGVRAGRKCNKRQRALQHLTLPSSTTTTTTKQHIIQHTDNIPCIYLLNPTSIAKPNALQQRITDINSVGTDVVITVVSWLKFEALRRHIQRAWIHMST